MRIIFLDCQSSKNSMMSQINQSNSLYHTYGESNYLQFILKGIISPDCKSRWHNWRNKKYFITRKRNKRQSKLGLFWNKECVHYFRLLQLTRSLICMSPCQNSGRSFTLFLFHTQTTEFQDFTFNRNKNKNEHCLVLTDLLSAVSVIKLKITEKREIRNVKFGLVGIWKIKTSKHPVARTYTFATRCTIAWFFPVQWKRT